MLTKAILPPGPKGRPIRGMMSEMQRDALGTLRSAASYGDVVALRVLGRTLYFINQPDYIKYVLVDNHRNYRKGRSVGALRPLVGNGLLTNEGEPHMRQRRLIQPAFHRSRIEGYAEIMCEYTAEQIARWSAGETRDLHHEMMKLTMSIVAKVLFDADVRGEASEIGGVLEALFDDFSLMDISPVGQFLARMPLPRSRRKQANRRILSDLIDRIIAERRRTGEDKGDALSMILQSQDDDGTGMSDQQARDEVMTLFLAGYETTANALSWTFYLLAQHPDVEARLAAELNDVLGSRAPTIADLHDLTYNHRVFSESLRLYPPAWAIGRMAIGQDVIGGYTIPAGASLIMSPYVMQRDARYWSEPDRFLPDRPDAEHEQERPRYAYFPFGGGPRLCIGEPFAWTEGELILATVLQRYHLTLAPGAVVEPEPLITLRLKYGLPMQIEAR